MSSITNILGKATAVALVPGAAVTATASSTGVDVSAYEGVARIVLDYSAGGAGATLDAVVEESADGSTGWAALANGNVGAFTQVGNVASTQSKNIDLDKAKAFLRVTSTVAGTASFKGSIILAALKKYV